MILICPSCDAKFNVPRSAIGDKGRKVRCALCGHTWTARQDDLLPPLPEAAKAPYHDDIDASVAAAARAALEAPPDRPALQSPSSEHTPDSIVDAVAEAIAAAPHGETDLVDDAEIVDDQTDTVDEPLTASRMDNDISEDDAQSEAALSAVSEGEADSIRADAVHPDFEQGLDDDDYVGRRRADQRRENDRKRQGRKRKITLIGWVLLLGMISALVFAGISMKPQIMAAWPASTKIYDLFKPTDSKADYRAFTGDQELSPAITDEPTRVVAFTTRSAIEEKDGRATLIVYGYVENQGRRSAKVPKVQADIMDRRGRVLDSWVFDPPGSIITRGQKLEFTAERYPIPSGAVNVAVKAIENAYSQTQAEVP